MDYTLLQGDCIEVMKTLPANSVHCVVTSPPFFGLRNYGVEGQIGMEATLEAYIDKLVEVFREVRRVLHPSGTVWLNLGDAYGHGTKAARQPSRTSNKISVGQHEAQGGRHGGGAKQLLMIPARVALALQADGWWLRQDIVWAKPNPMPESVTDRCTRSHEHLFMLAKNARYYYDGEAIKEPLAVGTAARLGQPDLNNQNGGYKVALHGASMPGRKSRDRKPSDILRHMRDTGTTGKNRRDVWVIPTRPYKGAHFATFPEALVEPCVLAGTSKQGCCPVCLAPWSRIVEKDNPPHDGATASAYSNGTTANRLALLRQAARARGEEYVNRSVTTGWRPTCSCEPAQPVPCLVLDLFNGSGTTGAVAMRLGCRYIGIDLKADYLDMSVARIEAVRDSAPLFFLEPESLHP